jgi:hypothetical protein
MSPPTALTLTDSPVMSNTAGSGGGIFSSCCVPGSGRGFVVETVEHLDTAPAARAHTQRAVCVTCDWTRATSRPRCGG